MEASILLLANGGFSLTPVAESRLLEQKASAFQPSQAPSIQYADDHVVVCVSRTTHSSHKVAVCLAAITTDSLFYFSCSHRMVQLVTEEMENQVVFP